MSACVSLSRRTSTARFPSAARLAGAVLALLVIVLAPAAPLQAQTQAQIQRFLELDKVLERHKAAGHWQQAVETAEQMRELVRSSGMPVHVEMATVDQLALAYLNLGKYPHALSLYQEMIQTCRTARSSNQEIARSLNRSMFAGLLGAGRAYRDLGQHEEAVAYFRQAADFAQRSGMPLDAAHASVDRSWSLQRLGRNDEAIELLLEALPIVKQGADHNRPYDSAQANYINALDYLAGAYDRIGRFDLGEPYHRAALDFAIRKVGWKHEHAAISADKMAQSYHMQGRMAEAEQLYRMAGAIFEATIGRQHPRYAMLLDNLAMLQIDPVQAEAMARDALRIKRLVYGDDHQQVAFSLRTLGNALSNQGRNAAAEPLVRQALAIFEKAYGPNDLATAQCREVLATCLLRQGAYQESLELVDQALAANQRNPFPPMLASNMHFLRAVPLEMLDRLDEAAEALDQGFALVEIHRAQTAGVERERAKAFECFTNAYNLAIRQRAKLGQVEAMFALIEAMKSRAFLDELQVQRVDLLAELPDSRRRELAERETQLRARLSQADAAFNALPEPGPNPTKEQAERQQQAAQAIFAARDALYQHLADVKASSKTYRELLTNQSETATLSDLQDELADGDLVLNYVVGDDHAYVIAVRKGSAEFAELLLDEPSAKLFGIEPGSLTRDKLASMLLEEEGGVMPALSSPQPLSAEIHAKLNALWTTLAPAAEREALTAGKVSRLAILPSGALSLLPFEALVVKNDEAPEYLLDVGPPVVYSPSASVLLNLARRQGEPAASAAPVLALGNPSYPQTSGQQDVVDRLMAESGTIRRTRAALSPLPFSGWEAKWVKQHFDEAGVGTTLLIGTEATEAAVRRGVAGRKIVHLACHGLADQSYGNFFGELALTPGRAGNPADDGRLSMSEIYGLGLDGCELAILSACQTNYGPEQRGEGVWALSRGFLVAGARRVAASNWVVDDEAGATLVSFFTSYLARTDPADYDYAASLHKAKQNVRKDARWAHPFYWSSLVLVGPK